MCLLDVLHFLNNTLTKNKSRIKDKLCPSISPEKAGDSPTEQVEAIINDVVCSFIKLHSDNDVNFFIT